MHTLEEIYQKVKYLGPSMAVITNTYDAGVPKTGQTASSATGDDGDLSKGVEWPDPRLVDQEDGTISDKLTGLTWLAKANYIGTDYSGFDADGTAGDGKVTWQHALDFISGMNSGTYTNFGYTDWRLPNLRELQSLVDYGRYNPSLPSGAPVSDVQWAWYWSSTSHSMSGGLAWRIEFGRGGLADQDKSNSWYVWPVRGGI